MNVTRHFILCLLAATPALLTLGGCAVQRPAAGLSPKPLLIHLPGIAGDSAMERWYLSALRTGGFDADSELYDWTSHPFWFQVLAAEQANRRAGVRLAARITDFAYEHPDRPIIITSDSGGAGPAVWALEALPPDVQVEAVVMLCPALSADYDLSPALSRVRRRMIAFHSVGDGMVLGWAARTFGTIDRKHVAAAGYTGFTLPGGAKDPAQYRKLEPVAYDPTWQRRFGNGGDHTGAMGSLFASGYLAPVLTQLALDARASSTPEATLTTMPALTRSK